MRIKMISKKLKKIIHEIEYNFNIRDLEKIVEVAEETIFQQKLAIDLMEGKYGEEDNDR
tara:strand:+ start:661 stop:837 length:177 start_codon:yes stop_codon:yes gene_type:complete